MLLTLQTMMPSVVTALAALTAAGQALAIVLLILLIARPRSALLRYLDGHGLLFLFLVALIASLGSLSFSEIAGWTPCKLCWFQRILMYPQALLLALALWRRDRSIVPYILLLGFIGICVSATHYTEQVRAALAVAAADPLKPCDASGVSCASAPFFTFGYITIPLMALTAFALNILGSWIMLRKNK